MSKSGFFKSFKKILDYAIDGGVKKTLVGLGVSVASIVLINTVINYYINKMMFYFNSLGSVGSLGNIGLSLLGIVGLDDALSIIISAFILKFAIKKAQAIASTK